MKKRALLIALLSAFSAPYALAQANNKPLRIIVAFAPGGPVDAMARTIAEPLGKSLGRTVIVENKPGASGAIGAGEVLKSEADGSVMWLTSVGAAAINPALFPKLAYNMQRDFTPVSLVANNVGPQARAVFPIWHWCNSSNRRGSICCMCLSMAWRRP